MSPVRKYVLFLAEKGAFPMLEDQKRRTVMCEVEEVVVIGCAGDITAGGMGQP